MSTTEERLRKLSEYESAEFETANKRAQYQADEEAANAAIQVASQSRQAWIDALKRQHVLDDEFDALNAQHEPSEVPADAATDAPTE